MDKLQEEIMTLLREEIRKIGYTEASRRSGIARPAIYKILKHGKVPRFETISKLLNAVGYKFVLETL